MCEDKNKKCDNTRHSGTQAVLARSGCAGTPLTLATFKTTCLPHTARPPTHRMSATTVFLFLLSWPLFASSRSLHGRTPSPLNIAARGRNVPPLGFYDPRDHGGSWLTVRASVAFLACPGLSGRPRSIASKQHIPTRPGRANKRRPPWNIRPCRPS